MKNQPCYDKEGNFLGWFSRSVAVVNVVLAKDELGEWHALVSQRGEGTPDPEYVGCWNLCCGYLDFDETVEAAARREVYEETGVNIDSDSPIRFWMYNSDPVGDKRQNVSFRFITILSNPTIYYQEQFSHQNNETNEVGEIAFIKIQDIDNYKWAFGHDQIIKDAIDSLTYHT